MLLGVSGCAGSGKSTFADILAKEHSYAVVSLADPIKRICREVFAFSEGQLWGPSPMRNEPDIRYPRGEGYLTPRHALQRIGTEVGRECYRDVWVEYALRVVRRLEEGRGHWQYKAMEGVVPCESSLRGPFRGVVIPDVRFANEMDAIRKAGGKLVRIHRPGSGLTGEAAAHASEAEQVGIPDESFDFVVENAGSLEDLRLSVGRLGF